MKKQAVVNLAMIAVLVLGVNLSALAEEGMMGEMKGEDAAMHEEMMAKWQEYSTPGENHKVLEPLVGTWEHSMRMWMAPDAEPEVTKGETVAEWILDGRFVRQTVTGTHMGMPFTGMGITGYDNHLKQYTSVWLDSMGTGMMMSTAQYDPVSKILTEEGSFTCPMRGKESFRGKITFIDNDHYKYEMFSKGPAGEVEYLSMAIEYTRK